MRCFLNGVSLWSWLLRWLEARGGWKLGMLTYRSNIIPYRDKANIFQFLIPPPRVSRTHTKEDPIRGIGH